jgi:hypothetical protein
VAEGRLAGVAAPNAAAGAANIAAVAPNAVAPNGVVGVAALDANYLYLYFILYIYI